MEIGNQIKQHRTALGLSQEELAEQVYITRQTLSNWETGKTYPDINSLLRLSAVFHVSLDELVKGDIPKMKDQINKNEVAYFKRSSNIYGGMLAGMVLSAVPLFYFFGKLGMGIWLLYCLVVFAYALHVDKLKKQHNIQTYKEIAAFMDGKHLDELEAAEEKGKRPYQKAFFIIGSALIGAVLGMVYTYLTM